MEKRLVRKTSDKIFGGVCAGLADYVGVNKRGLRFLAILAVMASGMIPGIFFYLLCVMLIPKEDSFAGWQSDHQYQRYDPRQDQWQSYANRQTKQQREPPAAAPEPTIEPLQTTSGGRTMGFILVLLGAGILVRTYLPWIDPRFLVAGGLIVIGIVLLFRKREDL